MTQKLKPEQMTLYLQKKNDLISTIPPLVIKQVPQEANARVNELAKLASSKTAKLKATAYREVLNSLCYHETEVIQNIVFQ